MAALLVPTSETAQAMAVVGGLRRGAYRSGARAPLYGLKMEGELLLQLSRNATLREVLREAFGDRLRALEARLGVETVTEPETERACDEDVSRVLEELEVVLGGDEGPSRLRDVLGFPAPEKPQLVMIEALYASYGRFWEESQILSKQLEDAKRREQDLESSLWKLSAEMGEMVRQRDELSDTTGEREREAEEARLRAARAEAKAARPPTGPSARELQRLETAWKGRRSPGKLWLDATEAVFFGSERGFSAANLTELFKGPDISAVQSVSTMATKRESVRTLHAEALKRAKYVDAFTAENTELSQVAVDDLKARTKGMVRALRALNTLMVEEFATGPSRLPEWAKVGTKANPGPLFVQLMRIVMAEYLVQYAVWNRKPFESVAYKVRDGTHKGSAVLPMGDLATKSWADDVQGLPPAVARTIKAEYPKRWDVAVQ